MISKQYSLEVKKWREILKLLFDLVLTLSGLGLAFRGHRENINDARCGVYLSILKLLAIHNQVFEQHLQSSLRIKYTSKIFTEEIIQILASVVDKLSVLKTHDQYNAIVIEAKTVWSSFDIFTDVLGPSEFPKKRTKKMPLQIDENTRGISLTEVKKHRQIYFETLDNMIGELNERMNGFSKVLDLFHFLNPDVLKKINIEDVKKKCEVLVLQYSYFTVNELSLEIM
jgi:hypothetical protein